MVIYLPANLPSKNATIHVGKSTSHIDLIRGNKALKLSHLCDNPSPPRRILKIQCGSEQLENHWNWDYCGWTSQFLSMVLFSKLSLNCGQFNKSNLQLWMNWNTFFDHQNGQVKNYWPFGEFVGQVGQKNWRIWFVSHAKSYDVTLKDRW